MTTPDLKFQFIDPLNNSKFFINLDIWPKLAIIKIKLNATNPNERYLWNKEIGIRYSVGTFTGILIFEEDATNTAPTRTAFISIPQNDFTKQNISQKIPKKIYQAWLQAEPNAFGELQVPNDMKTVMQTWKDLNPDYEYELFNEAKIKAFFETNFPPIYLETYNLLLPRAYRVDFWRYCVLYKYGGVYSDSKMALLKSLSEIIRPTDEFIVCNDSGEFIAIAFLAFTPKHPLLEHIIFNIINNVTQRYKSDSPLGLTGPHLFGRIVKLYLNITGAITCGSSDKYQILKFSTITGYFYDNHNNKIIKYLYDSYKKNDNQEWNHYPTLWTNNIVFDDKVENPALRELAFLREKPEWLKLNEQQNETTS